jgi:regulator of protease activity HflC (stomatin/prohibitin superfamily)
MYTLLKRKWQEGQGWASLGLGLVIVALVIAAAYAFMACSPVDPGQVKVVKQFGEIVRVNTEGLNWITPLIQTTETYDIRTKTYEVSGNPDTTNADYPDWSVSAQTTDGQQISINYTVKFRVDATRIATILREFGNLNAVVENIVKADSRSWVRKLAQNYEAESLFSGEGVLLFETQVSDTLKDLYAAQNVILVEFLIRKIDFDANYVKTIEDQQIAQEQMRREQNRLSSLHRLRPTPSL